MFVCPYSRCCYQNYRTSRMNSSHIRILHASPNAPAVDIYLNDNLILQGLAYKNFSDYFEVPAGTYNIKVYPAGTKTNPVINTNTFIPDNSIFTAAAIGLLPNISLMPIEEPRIPKIPGKVSVRFVHLSPDAPEVDVALPNGRKLFTNVSYQEVTNYIPIDPGVYTFEVYLAGTDKKILFVPNARLTPNRFYTLYAVGLASGTPPLQMLIPLDGNSYI